MTDDSNNFDLSQFKETFFEECSDLLGELETLLTDMQWDKDAVAKADPEVLNAIFRCVHSIKGGAGAFDFTALVGFAHIYETLLDCLREGEVEISNDCVAILIQAADVLADHIAAARGE